jgi:hypothetical protein
VELVPWRRGQASVVEEALRDQCLLIPSLEVGQIAAVTQGHLRFAFNPRPEHAGKLDSYRRPLNELGRITVEQTRKQTGQALGPPFRRQL